MSRRIVLLVDDDKQFRDTMLQRMELRGFDVTAVSSGAEALKLASMHEPALAVVDMRMPDMDGLETIAKLREQHPGIRTALLTGHGGSALRSAAQAQHAEYFEKQDMGELWERLERLKADLRFFDLNGGAAETGENRDSSERIIGQTAVMQQLKRDADKAAALDCTVLLLGETGTGKEMLARSIHSKSARARARFLAVNCGSFTHDLISGELFGQEGRGPSSQQTAGVFESASGGAVLLDEVGDTPLSMQSQLLRLLQDRTIFRLGGSQEVHVDVRIMATSNQDLGAKIRAGEFREDFYYRLNVFTLYAPPLRQRTDDIAPLCNYFMDRYSRAFGLNVEGFDDEVLDLLLAHPFPGNVRELENIVERAVIVRREGVIRREDLPRRFQDRRPDSEPAQPLHAEPAMQSLAEVEQAHIRRVLDALGNNKTKAAKTLGISRAGLWRKLKAMDAASPAGNKPDQKKS